MGGGVEKTDFPFKELPYKHNSEESEEDEKRRWLKWDMLEGAEGVHTKHNEHTAPEVHHDIKPPVVPVE